MLRVIVLNAQRLFRDCTAKKRIGVEKPGFFLWRPVVLLIEAGLFAGESFVERIVNQEINMSNSMLEYTCSRIRWHHAALLRVTSDLTPEQFNWRPGPQAPPIGWHLWHIARWADRVQIAFPTHGGAPRTQIWEDEGLAQRWGLDSSKLGILQAGEGMDHDAAAHIPVQIGQENILSYAERCFATFNAAMDDLEPDDIEWVRPNTQAYEVSLETRQLVSAPAPETPFASDLAYQLTHAARHLGMIEALRGAQGFLGTASA